MSNRDPLAPERRGLDEEDLIALGQDDPDDATDVTDDPMVAADNAEPYLPPTDPPVVPGGRDTIEVAQGFAATSDAPDEDTGLATSDETITERVRHQLRIDSATSGLDDVHVHTRDGVVHLHGTVPGIEDTDLAAEVASRVPGVVDVVDELRVQE